MKLSHYIHFKPPTIYDVIVTVGILASIPLLWNVKTSQAAMRKEYITKEYLYSFYITVDQIKAIENERPKYLERIASGESRDSVSADFIDYVDLIVRLRTRGL